MATQTYNFLQNLSEEVRGRDNAVLAVSIPASELEMNTEDVADYQRLDKLLDRLGKAVIMSAEGETSEIIRRRLFDWDGVLDNDAKRTVAAYAEWVVDHRQQVPSWFPVDQARDQHGRDIDAGAVAWSATGGTIEQDGVFLAGEDEGNFLVTAKVGDVQGTAGVTVVKPGVVPPPIKPPPFHEVTGLSWEGEIPPQKWMNFYTKVLSKFAAGKGLRIIVRFELSDGALSRQKIEETKLALRELGLGDDVEVS